jgi:phosphatidate cytidylyltransferase
VSADTVAPADRLSKRVLPGLLLVVLALGSIYLGGIAYLVVCGVLACTMSWEWVRLVTPRGHRWWSSVAAACTGFVALIAGLFGSLEYPLYASIVLAILFSGTAVLGRQGRERAARLLLWLPGAIVWPSIFLISATFIRQSDDGLATAVWLCVVVWGTDIGAYLIGRTVGGPRLAPRLSPGKTWSGAVGGLLAAAIAGGLLGWGSSSLGWAGGDAALGIVGVFALVFSVISQAGDLLESAIKRHFGAKDSGTLIPGHGGVLDRLDSLSVAAAVLALAMYLSGLGPLSWGGG